MSLRNFLRRISKDHGSTGVRTNTGVPVVKPTRSRNELKQTKKLSVVVTKEAAREDKKVKMRKSPIIHDDTTVMPIVMDQNCVDPMDQNCVDPMDQNCVDPMDTMAGPAEGYEDKSKVDQMLSELVRNSECKTQEIAALKMEISRLKENIRERLSSQNTNGNKISSSKNDPTTSFSQNKGDSSLDDNLDEVVNKLTAENALLRKHLQKFGVVSFDTSPLSDQQKEIILSKVSAMPQGGLMCAGSMCGLEKEWDNKSSSSLSEISVACLQGRIQQMEETHYSTNEELQATLQELEDLKEQLTECQLELQQMQEEKQVILESLTQQTEKLNESRGYNDTLKLMLIQQSENNHEISQCERTQRLMELLKILQEDKELLQVQQEELDKQLNVNKEAERHFHSETALIRERMKMLEAMAESAQCEKKMVHCKLQKSDEKIRSYMQDVERLQTSLITCKEKIGELEATVISGEKSDMVDVLERVSCEKDLLETELSSFHQKYDRVMSENDRLKGQLNNLENELKTKKNEVFAASQEIENKNNQLEKVSSKHEYETESMRLSISELQTTCQRHLEDKRDLKANLSETMKKLSDTVQNFEELQRAATEDRTLFDKQFEEWEQFQNDLLTTVRVANDFKTEAQHDVERLQQENQCLKEKMKQLDKDLVKTRAVTAKIQNQSTVHLNTSALNYTNAERRLMRTVSHTPSTELIFNDRRSHPRPLSRGDSRVKCLIESIECATKQTRVGSRSSSTSSLASSSSENTNNMNSIPPLKRADTESVILNKPQTLKENMSNSTPLRALNCNIEYGKHSVSSTNLSDTVKMSQLSGDKSSSKYNGNFNTSNVGPVEVTKQVSILANMIEPIRRNSYGQVSSSIDKKDPLATLAQRGDTKRNALLKWCQHKTVTYPHVDITNFSTSWNDGMALCALLDSYMPDKINYNGLNPQQNKKNFEVGLAAAESVGIKTTLDIGDMTTSERPSWQMVFNYVTSVFCHFET